jgi:hypothetical protein
MHYADRLHRLAVIKAEAAVDAGASVAEVVDVPVGVLPVIGTAVVVAAARDRRSP